MKYLTMLVIILSLNNLNGIQAQDNQTNKLFIGYETLEMSMNNFQYFAGEIGYRIDPKNQISVTIGEVKLTERHLSSKYEAAAIDGDNVEGYLRIYEANYNRFFGKKKLWHYGGNIGLVNDKYDHLISDNSINNTSATVGFNFGFQKMNLFNIKHLQTHIVIPFRYYFNSIPEQQWGNTKVLEHKFVNNIWLFLGYNF